MHNFSLFYPRTENSAGERKTLAHIEERLKSLGVSYERTGLSGFPGFHSFSSNIHARIEGKRPDSIYFIVPINHPADAPVHRSYSLGPALGLALAEELAGRDLPVSVHILFLGAEKGRDPAYHIGSKAFLYRFTPGHNVAFVYMDFASPPSVLAVRPAGTKMVSPAWMLEKLYRALFRTKTRFKIENSSFQIHRLGLNDLPSPIDPYLDAGFPALYLYQDKEEPLQQPLPPSDIIAALSLFVSSFDEGLPSRWDSHYQFIQMEEYLVLVNEIYYVVLLLLLLAATLMYPFVRSKRFFKYARSILRHLFIVPILLIAMVIHLYLATLLLEGIMELRGIPELWRLRPVSFLFLKMVSASFLFSLSLHLLKVFHLSRLRGSFYSASALLFVLFDILLLTVLDISLTFYGVWIFFFAFLFSIARSRMMKFLYLLLSFSLVAGLVLQIFLQSHYDAMRLILLSSRTGNIVIALNLLPFMLMLLRLRMLFHHPNPRKTKWIIAGFDISLAAAAGTLIVSLLYHAPYTATGSQPLTIEEVLSVPDKRRSLHIESPVPIDSLLITGADYRIDETIDKAGFSRRLPYSENPLELQVQRREFLGRAAYQVTILPPQNSESTAFHLDAQEAIVLYDCSFPTSFSTNRKRLTVHIGRFPPTPLKLSFTVPIDFTGRLTVETTSYTPPYEAELPEERFDLRYRYRARIEREISGHR